MLTGRPSDFVGKCRFSGELLEINSLMIISKKLVT
jgi:hypothetical protein